VRLKKEGLMAAIELDTLSSSEDWILERADGRHDASREMRSGHALTLGRGDDESRQSELPLLLSYIRTAIQSYTPRCFHQCAHGTLVASPRKYRHNATGDKNRILAAMSATPSVARAVEHHPVVASTARGSTAPASVSGESSSQRHTSAFSPYQKDLDVSPLTNLAKETLLETLTDIQGQKTLVLDKALSGPLGLVTDVALLKVCTDKQGL
jgi:hypothetical protein